MNSILRHLRRAVLLSGTESLSDAHLLDAFLAHRDGVAFEAMLRRHAPMVFGVCRRILRNVHDAEDAFQATFLVLARKAGSIRSQQVLASWLYGVAYRTAMKARTMNMKRRERELEACPKPPADRANEELLAQLDYVLSHLPEKYRVPVVLCELEGMSRKEAARALGVPEGTLSWRLAQAKKLLARRLLRYGAVAVAALLAEGAASARPSPFLLKSTAQAVLKAGVVPAQVIALTDGVLKAMLLTKLKITVIAAGLMLLTGIGATGLTYRATAQQPGSGVARESRPLADDLEALRLEIEALRKSLQATRERVKALELEVTVLKGRPASGNQQEANMPRMTNMMSGQKRGITTGQQKPSSTAPDSGSKDTPAAKPGTDNRRLDGYANERPGQQRPETAADPLAEAEAALKKLCRDPSDKDAAEALERALQRLKAKERTNPLRGQ
jgi:RNA polymerase sigma factor (sigma-70 family)